MPAPRGSTISRSVPAGGGRGGRAAETARSCADFACCERECVHACQTMQCTYVAATRRSTATRLRRQSGTAYQPRWNRRVVPLTPLPGPVPHALV
eukprot:5820552-Alexandrium_andersonii.AAC.1